MFGIGFQEILIILVIALIIIGPKKLPDIAKALGRALGEFRRTTDDIRSGIEKEAKAVENSYENDKKEDETAQEKGKVKQEPDAAGGTEPDFKEGKPR